jgi:hypothetical protein
MKIQSLFIVSIICFFSAGASAESGGAATGLCKDGTSYTGTSKKGACRGHKGIKEWYGDKASAAPSTPVVAAPAAAASGSGVATGMCKDGTPYTGSSKKGACRGHKGLKEFYADNNAPKSSAPAPATAAPAPAASDGIATGLCKDGTSYTGSSKRGACRGHKGIKEWYADKQTPAAANETVPPAAAPANAAPAAAGGAATGLCKDGTTYTGASKRGACRGHKGVKEWYADQQSPTAGAAAPAPAQAAPTAPAAATPAQTTTSPAAAPARAATPAPAAGSGKVWVNTRSKIYHCEGSKFYGNTKEGEYMNEADAQAQGYNANRKKVCH